MTVKLKLEEDGEQDCKTGKEASNEGEMVRNFQKVSKWPRSE